MRNSADADGQMEAHGNLIGAPVGRQITRRR